MRNFTSLLDKASLQIEGSTIHDSKAPFVSVIIPVKNDKLHLRQCLDCILQQSYPTNQIEILGIDAMSTDGTRDIVAGLSSRPGNPTFKLINDRKGQRTHALNQGIANANGDIIIRIDARTIVPKDYIEKYVQTLLEQKVDNVGGIIRPIGNALIQKAIGLAMSHPFGIGNAQFRIGKKSGPVDTVYLGCLWKKVFDRIGPFDENAPIISEDSDINFRIRQAGGIVYLDTNITVFYYPREHLSDLWRLYFRYGGARAGFLLKHKRISSLRSLAPPCFLLSLFLLSLLSLTSPLFLLAFFGLASIYLLADLFASLSLTVNSGNSKLLPPLMRPLHNVLFVIARRPEADEAIS